MLDLTNGLKMGQLKSDKAARRGQVRAAIWRELELGLMGATCGAEDFNRKPGVYGGEHLERSYKGVQEFCCSIRSFEQSHMVHTTCAYIYNYMHFEAEIIYMYIQMLKRSDKGVDEDNRDSPPRPDYGGPNLWTGRGERKAAGTHSCSFSSSLTCYIAYEVSRNYNSTNTYIPKRRYHNSLRDHLTPTDCGYNRRHVDVRQRLPKNKEPSSFWRRAIIRANGFQLGRKSRVSWRRTSGTRSHGRQHMSCRWA
ncbi:unnamed protein product [Nezara viridula]|uniref:Uncharacterized protein n=1 Tax=Nezara viridula TaxID=85310 RepID=A0A9P0H9G2_NEZVI|nr:unnamed protein product [Nezara viridula]